MPYFVRFMGVDHYKSETIQKTNQTNIEQQRNPAKFINGWISLCLVPETIAISSLQYVNRTTQTSR